MTTETLEPTQETLTDETVAPMDSPDDDAQEETRSDRTRLVVVGVAIAALFLLFLGFGSVTAFMEPLPGGARETRDMRVVRLWELLHDTLPDVEHQGLLRLALDAALVVLILSIIAGLWLALAATPDVAPPSETSDGSA